MSSVQQKVITIKSLDTRETAGLKGTAISLVVLGHLHVIPYGGALGVAIFLIVSGYGLEKSWQKSGLYRFWQKRIAKVWLPYVIWSIGLFSFYQVTKVKDLAGLSKINTITAIIGLNPYTKIDMTMWYIPYIFLSYLIFYCCKKISPKESNKIITGAFVVLSVLCAVGLFPRYSGAWLYMLCVPGGALYADLESKQFEINRMILCIATVLCVAGLCSGMLIERYGPIPYFFFVCDFIGVVFCSIYWGAEWLGNGLLCWIGQRSFAFYLCESAILDYVNSHSQNWSEFAKVAITIVAIVMAGEVIHLIWCSIKYWWFKNYGEKHKFK